ncbi:exported hypothetical protein [Thiomonas sp. X19]|uniref:hypothetical protein n=1 Tax=Thiomonas sp. X19 TaxID=1050370 RepID=UPI000B635A23|nr:hypothetical protein [Thiomonas sp. X19]SCC95827.1 exported hypothetical protein [Thiomonas sp. X19]
MKKQLSILALAIASTLALASASHAAQVSAGAGLTYGQIDGLGLHNVSAYGITAGVGVTGSPAGIPLAATASITRLRGGGVTEQQADASLAYVYSPRAVPGLALMPTVQIGHDALIGGAATSHVAAGLAASYRLGRTSPWALSASYLRGETIDGGACGACGTGPYQAGSLAVSYAHPLGLPGSASLAYQRTRWLAAGASAGMGDQYVRSNEMTAGYEQTF